MNIMVTGGTGFIGRHIVWRLAAKGCNVLFSGRDARAAAQVMHHSPAPVLWVPLAHGTPAAAHALADATRGCEAIVHCAALSSPWGQAQAFTQANVTSTEEVLGACRTNAVRRLVHLSTPSLYFDFCDRIGIGENEPLPPPVNTYARTKALAEARIRDACLEQAVILRPRAVFGPWDQTLMPRLLRVMQKGPIPLMRGGRALLDLTCIGNLVHAVELSLTQALPRSLCTYNVSNGTPVTVEQLLRQVAEEFRLPLHTRKLPWRLVDTLARGLELIARARGDHEPRLTRYSAGVLAFSQTLDLRAITHELGYRPVISQDEGIRQYAQWWLAREGAPT
ncbi:NAD(P)-dependent oxidoreductase [Pseudomonas sp. RIT-PI-S]|uniref:NAD-dependent epimerase/dehydratase family protein n=1 Tax=Pseudomonas sp. RIT-PI-S TaxID=3035295 RepID=UPI0021DA71DF|nr:NAD(P)-dependent oxidoreductase [Pseudomonas sp. RIT-PI-S]